MGSQVLWILRGGGPEGSQACFCLILYVCVVFMLLEIAVCVVVKLTKCRAPEQLDDVMTEEVSGAPRWDA